MENNSDNQVLDFNSLAEFLDGNRACRFVSLVYRAQPKVPKHPEAKGELARHTIMLNVSREKMLRRDRAILLAKRPTLKGVDALACDELVASLTETIETGTNCRYTKQGYYEAHGNNNVQTSIKQVAYIRGYTLGKQVIEAGFPASPLVNSSPKTVAKNKLRKLLKSARCREFRITPENLVTARTAGQTLVIDASNRFAKLATLSPVIMKKVYEPSI